jgi:hypothetical protein
MLARRRRVVVEAEEGENQNKLLIRIKSFYYFDLNKIIL